MAVGIVLAGGIEMTQQTVAETEPTRLLVVGNADCTHSLCAERDWNGPPLTEDSRIEIPGLGRIQEVWRYHRNTAHFLIERREVEDLLAAKCGWRPHTAQGAPVV